MKHSCHEAWWKDATYRPSKFPDFIRILWNNLEAEELEHAETRMELGKCNRQLAKAQDDVASLHRELEQARDRAEALGAEPGKAEKDADDAPEEPTKEVPEDMNFYDYTRIGSWREGMQARVNFLLAQARKMPALLKRIEKLDPPSTKETTP